MSIFGKILGKLGLSKAEAAPSPAGETPPMAPPGTVSASAPASAEPAAESAAAPDAVSIVDVGAHLEWLAADNPQTLNWRQSIVDLLKLLDIDSSYAARKELATELGCPAELMGDSAQMNIWLHKTVLRKLSENGGQVPADLLD
jgi:hypothetical protein